MVLRLREGLDGAAAMDIGYPARGLCFIRHIETAETYRNSSIIVPEQTRDRITACQFEIVAVGDYAMCEDEDCERWHTKRHEHRHHLYEKDWILVKFRSWGPTPDPDVYVVRQEDVLARFRET